jgi:hypothetical protein
MDEQQTFNQPKREYLVIKIPKPELSEREFWIAAVLILAVVAFYQPLSGYTTDGAGFISNGISYISDTFFGESTEVSGSVVTETVKAPPVEIPKEEVKAPVEVPAEKPLSGIVTLKIIKVNSENKGSWGKITSVDYEVDNDKAEFYPLVKIFAYDEHDDSTLKQSEKGREDSVSPLPVREKKIGRISLTGASFADLTVPKTVVVQLYDQGTEKFLKGVETIITIN